MKKQILDLGKALSKKQQKEIFGGRAQSEGCAYQAGNGNDGAGAIGAGLGWAEAGAIANGGHYCCDSCCDVGWLGDQAKSLLGCEPTIQ
jgi:hypothetical protein